MRLSTGHMGWEGFLDFPGIGITISREIREILPFHTQPTSLREVTRTVDKRRVASSDIFVPVFGKRKA